MYNYFIMILIAVILGISLYLIIFAVYYYKEKCHVKKSYGAFISTADINKSPCVIKDKPKINIRKKPKLDKSAGKEVFQITDQIFNYNEAQCKCAGYGAELATKEQITEAYNKGANWCSYGWSKGQNAYYPTQKCAWDELQKTDNKNKCGDPGVNGGRFPATVRFGANCYGFKPKGLTVKEKKPVCKKVGFCKKIENKEVSIASHDDTIIDFSNDKWSVYDN